MPYNHAIYVSGNGHLQPASQTLANQALTEIGPQNRSQVQAAYAAPTFAQKCKVVLAVLCETNIGQRVAVVGNASAIGAWDISRPLILNTDERVYPSWQC